MLTAVTAVFTLAYKLQPSIIFIDEVDSFLGQRRVSEHEALTNMKTEFMALWDGFTTDRKTLNFLKVHNSQNIIHGYFCADVLLLENQGLQNMYVPSHLALLLSVCT